MAAVTSNHSSMVSPTSTHTLPGSTRSTGDISARLSGTTEPGSDALGSGTHSMRNRANRVFSVAPAVVGFRSLNGLPPMSRVL